MKNARLPIGPGASASVRPCRIEVFGGGAFQFAEAGIAAMSADVPDGAGRAIDTVAWTASDEGRWFMQRGVAIIAGEDALVRADWYGAPVVLYSTPAEWHRQRDKGNIQAACILDANADFERILGEAPYLYADAKLKKRIDAIQRAKLMHRTLPLHIEISTEDDARLMVEAFKVEVRRGAA